MEPVTRQRLLAAGWRLIEAMRSHSIARLILGLLNLLGAISAAMQGKKYLALERSSRIQRVLELPRLSRIAAALERRLAQSTYLDPETGGARESVDNSLVDDFRCSRAADSLFQGGLDSFERIVRLGGELLVLKAPDFRTGELGVLILKYTPAFGRFAALYDLPRLFQHFQVVLEPSWVGYHDPIFQLFNASERRVLVEAQHPSDAEVLRKTGSSLVPVPCGAGHWVNSKNFHPVPAISKDYLAVLIANWAPHKRHHIVLNALMRVSDPSARIALVGYPWKGFTKQRIEREAIQRNLGDRVDVYERIDRKMVNEVLNRSHANLLISRKEGASKILYEGFAAGTPCVVLEDHEGACPTDINERTGLRCQPNELAEALEWIRDQGYFFGPREWWQENASPEVSRAKLEAVLRECALAEGRPFTRGIELKTNDPNLAYVDPDASRRLRPVLAQLSLLLRPDEELLRYRLSFGDQGKS
ncbi:glycosyltransferase [Myxococcota bacterium]|nr:glycosyltransferase [Myxococcota bacterium]